VGWVPSFEGDHEVQLAVSKTIELYSRRRAEQVEALDAVARADPPYLLDSVFNERNHSSTPLAQNVQKEGPERVPRPSCVGR
jgi:hypothetical protein